MIDYKQSGVDVEEGYKAVNKYKAHAARTKIPGMMGGLGSFAGMFQIPAGMKEPIMVSGTDGVGTKLDIAFKLGKYDTVGIDCVAMSVNDILCCGCQTSFFLDYVACGSLDADVAADLVKGVADGCVDTGCCLLGGETAEMPDFYDKGKYDLAGFGVGVVEKADILDGSKIKKGDVLIGLSSTGPHSNGYSLIRKLVKDFNEPFVVEGIDTGKTIGEVLLRPTRIYVKPVMAVMKELPGAIHGMSHITGGGFYENIPRMYPDSEKAGVQFTSIIKKGSWDILPIFNELIKRGADPEKVYSTWNMGLGLILAVDAEKADKIVARFNELSKDMDSHGCEPMKAYKIGEVSTTDEKIEEVKGSKIVTQLVD